MTEEKNMRERAQEYDASQIQVLESLKLSGNVLVCT